MLKFRLIQDLNLTVGQKASCCAGYPNSYRVVVTCIRDFDTCSDRYQIINYFSLFCVSDSVILTSHLISPCWCIIK